jgi:PAS domain S-box-containing protein
MDQVVDFFKELFDSSDWPPRWHCGRWTEFHGWLYIISDLLIWSAYFTIPIVIIRFISKKQDIKFARLYFLFAAFILACGATHFLDALAFWIPAYRLNALMRFITGIVSWVTVFYLVKYLPVVFSLKSQKDLEVEIAQRKKAEEKFRGLLEAAPDAMVISNEKGEIVLINRQTENMFGFTKEELIGKKVEILIPAEFHSKHVVDRTHYFENPKVRIMGAGLNLFAKRKDGTQIPVEISLSPLVTEEGTLISASIRDISLRKASEEKLKKAKNDFQLLVSSIKDYAIFLLDTEGCVTSWNSGAEHIKGYTEEEIIGKPMEVFYTTEEIEKGEPKRNLQMALQNGHFETEGWRVGKNGYSFFANIVFTSLFDEKGSLYGYATVTKDVTEKRKAEEDLKNFNKALLLSRQQIEESEKRFRNVVEQSVNPILILKGEELKLELANEPLFKLWNVGKESLGKPFLEILPEMKDQPFVELLLDVYRNGATHYGNDQPAYFIRENGKTETVYFNFVYLPYRENDNSISGVIVQATDVSTQVFARKKIETSEANLLIANRELKNTEAALNNLNAELEQKVKQRTEDVLKSERRFRAMIENNSDFINITDESYKIIYRSPSAYRITGWTNEEIVNAPGYLNIHPDDREKANQVIRDALANPGIPINAVLRTLHKNGQYIWLEGVVTNLLHDENVKGFVSNYHDVTEREEAHKKLLASEVRYRRLFETAKDGILILNSETGILEDVNPFLIEMLGYSHDELLGKQLWEIGLFKDIVENKSAFEKLKNEQYIRYDNLPLETKRGKAIWVEFVSNVYPVDGIPVIQCNIRDISERKQAEDKIKKLNTELEERVLSRTVQLKKANEELEAFTYSVSHDLRAPLRGIVGFTAILEEDYASKLDDEARRITTVIKNNTLKMGHLIDDLLDFSRMGKQEIIKTAIDTADLVKEIILEQMAHQKMQNAIAWDIRDLISMHADKNTIRQVWVNLISNAVKYSGNHKMPHIEIGSYVKDEQNVFYVQDNGVGFDEQYSDKLFKVFQRLHSTEEFEGTGVGLALVEKIVSKHGGKVWAKGKENIGACFSFSLPV